MNDDDFTSRNAETAKILEFVAEVLLVMFAATIAAVILIWCI